MVGETQLVGRAGLWAFFALSVVAAIGCSVYGFWDQRYYFGIGFLLAAMMYWGSIRWVDRHGSWETTKPTRQRTKMVAVPQTAFSSLNSRRGKRMPCVESLTFDLADCVLQERTDNHRGWMTPSGIAHSLRFHAGPPDWPFDLTKPDDATAFYRKQCSDNGGAMLSMGVATAAGVEALHGVFKYRAPVPGSLAMYYVAILWLPFNDCRFQINVEAMESGTTGVREAVVMLIEGDKWPKPAQESPPVVLNSAEELFQRLGSAQVRQLPSDDERYDSSFPDHPLSQVRTRLARVVSSVKFDASAGSLRPFRVRRGWKFWK